MKKINWHIVFHWFTAVWTCLGFEQDYEYVRYKCDICGKEVLKDT